jgi:vacuolar-type H+-ATPase subunit E/Vma4
MIDEILEGGEIMTVGTQLTRAIEIIENASVTMKTVSLETQDQQVKQTFEQTATTLDNALETLKQRL